MTRAASRHWRPRRLRALGPALLAAAIICAWSGSAAAAEQDPESGFVTNINLERSARGLPPLGSADDLVAVARAHSAGMARSRRLEHNSRLAVQVDGWDRLAENVGFGRSVDELHPAFMSSVDHRRHILDPRLVEIGVGVIRSGNQLWVTQVFRQPSPALLTVSSPPASSPPQPIPDPFPAQVLPPYAPPAAVIEGSSSPTPASSTVDDSHVPPAVEARSTLVTPFEAAPLVESSAGTPQPLPTGPGPAGRPWGCSGLSFLLGLDYSEDAERKHTPDSWRASVSRRAPPGAVRPEWTTVCPLGGARFPAQ